MAIVEMQKLGIYAGKKHRKDILEFLQSMGAMEVDVSKAASEQFEKQDTQAERMKFEKVADAFDNAIELLKKKAPKEKKKLLNLELELIPKAEEDEIIAHKAEIYSDANTVLSLEKQIAESQAIIARKNNKITSLMPWLSLDIPLNEVGTKKTKILIGSFPEILEADQIMAAAISEIPEADDSLPVDVNIVSSENQVTNVCIVTTNRLVDQVEAGLRSHGFSRLPFITHRIPAEAIEKRKRDIADEEAKIAAAEEKQISFADQLMKFKIASDYYRTRAEKYKVLGSLPQSKNVFFMEGWIPKDKLDPISTVLTEKFGAVIDLEEVSDEDVEPVVLKNNRFSESAEGVLESYGLPKHGRVDPTFIMSIFYVFFFGMMLSDAAYGIIMSIATGLVLLKNKRLASGMRKMMQLFFWCGLSTAFWGFMFGGFFGDAIDVIAKTFFGYTGATPILKPLWFAPLENPMRLLIWCMLFGLIHLYFGLGMKGYEMLKAHDIKGFISDIVSWYLFLTGLVFMLLPSSLFESIAQTEYNFPSWVAPLAKRMTIAGLLIILVMSGRSSKNWGLRIALGAYDIYGVTSWLSDVLSYSRLLALGLATGVIASVINMMASMVGSGVVGAILFIIIFILGHTLNMAINLLGAYVHTNRLQFVEFFGKFYDAGGEPFHPFQTIHKYVEIKED